MRPLALFVPFTYRKDLPSLHKLQLVKFEIPTILYLRGMYTTQSYIIM